MLIELKCACSAR